MTKQPDLMTTLSVITFVAAMVLGCGESSSPYIGSDEQDASVSQIGNWIPPMPSFSNTVHVRPPGETYGTGDGSSWTNAISGFPQPLRRGTRYVAAAGDYYIEDPIADDPVYAFNTPEDGAAYIGVYKATVADHGADEGWDDAFSQGTVILGPSSFVTGYYIIDGQTGTGAEDRGIHFLTRECLDGGQSSRWATVIFPWDTTATHVAFLNVEISACGDYGDQSIRSEDNVYNVAPIANVIYRNCYIHDAWRCQFMIQDATDVVIEDSYLARAGMQHESCTIALRNTTNVIIQRNFIIDSLNTFVSLQRTRNVFITSNVLTRSLDGWDNWAVIHVAQPSLNTTVAGNTFTHISGLNGGFKQDAEFDRFIIRNNLFAHQLTNQIGIIGDASHNSYYNNTRINGVDTPTQISPSAVDQDPEVLTSDPFTDAASYDFTLVAPTSPGLSMDAPFGTDMLNMPRGRDGTWDRGAFEYHN